MLNASIYECICKGKVMICFFYKLILYIFANRTGAYIIADGSTICLYAFRPSGIRMVANGELAEVDGRVVRFYYDEFSVIIKVYVCYAYAVSTVGAIRTIGAVCTVAAVRAYYLA